MGVPDGAPGGTETILIVEDDSAVRNMVKNILTQRGYRTIEAVNGDDGLEIYSHHHHRIDLVILDVVMPGRNGKMVFDELLNLNPAVKAIFMSGYTGDIVLAKGVQSQSVDFLPKPLSVAGLLSKVREVLDR